MNIVFDYAKINDKKIFDSYNNSPILKDYTASELNFASFYSWCMADDLKIAFYENYVFVKGNDFGKTFFFPPLAHSINEFKQALIILKQYCQENAIHFIIYGLNDYMKTLAIDVFNDQFYFYHHCDYDEYLYLSADIIDLNGKKFHSKRNHIKNFLASYNPICRPYETTDFLPIIDALRNWNDGKTLDYEETAIIRALNNLTELDAFCDVFYIDNTLIAFSIGAINHESIGITLFEKANMEYDGIYSYVCNIFAKRHFYNCAYINRQEDMGIYNLKKSKLSYNPSSFSIKYSLVDTSIISNFKALLIECFPQDINPPQFFDYLLHNKINFHNLHYLMKDNFIISALALFPRLLTFYGKIFDVPLIAYAGTAIKYRNKGYFRKLIESALIRCKLSSAPATILFPVDYKLYFKFGFAIMNYCQISNDNNIDFQPISTIKDIESYPSILERIYNNCATKHNCYIIRDLNYFTNLINEVNSYNGKIEIGFKDNTIIAYRIMNGNTIEEIVIENSTLSNIPNGMIRILNPEMLLSSYQYPLITTCVTFKLIDDIIEENNRYFTINLINGFPNITISKTVVCYDCNLSIIDLSN
ncbi:MAG: GNAT family N-acetyltransferase, partial [Clostridia bacterium]